MVENFKINNQLGFVVSCYKVVYILDTTAFKVGKRSEKCSISVILLLISVHFQYIHFQYVNKMIPVILSVIYISIQSFNGLSL